MKKLLFLSLAIIFACLTANAQTVTYEWKQYGLSFSVPSNFKILENTSESFEAQNNEIHLTIEVLDYEGLSPEFMGTLLGEMANSMGMHSAEIGELALTTLVGAYIEGIVENSNVILVVLMDVDSNIALLSSIVYEDGNERRATNIVNSFAIK